MTETTTHIRAWAAEGARVGLTTCTRDELDRLREWKIDASAALDQYEDYRASIEAAMQKALEIR